MATTLEYLRSAITQINDAILRLEKYPHLDNDNIRDDARALDAEAGDVADTITDAE